MSESDSYRLGLTHLLYLIISADNVVEPSEISAMKTILLNENVSENEIDEFLVVLEEKKERELYETGIDLISKCTEEEKLRAFAWLHKMSEVDGHVHVKEVRFLLYSVKHAGIDLDDVVEVAKKLPELPKI